MTLIQSLDKKIIFEIISIKICVLLIIFLSYSLLPFFYESYYVNKHYPEKANVSLLTAYATWDAQHYLYLSQEGYKKGVTSDAFYPLFPALIAVVTFIVRNPIIAGLLVSNVFSGAGCYFFYRFCSFFLHDHNHVQKSLLLLLIFPTAFYFTLIYSESLFFFLAVMFFYYLYKNNYKLSSIFAFLLPLTRPLGIFVFIPFLIYYLRQHAKRKKGASLLAAQISFEKNFFFILAPFIGFAVYLGSMFLFTGNALEGIHAAHTFLSEWHISGILHPELFLHAITLWPLSIHGFTDSILDRIFFIIFLLCLPLVYKKTDPVLFSFYVLMGMVPFFGTFMSYMRYLVLAFPLFIALARVFSEKRFAFLFLPYVFLSYSLFIFFVVLQALDHWVG